MAAKQTNIALLLQPDSALAQTGNYRFDATDRQYVDTQILACQQHLADSLLNGTTASWYVVDIASASLAVGDVVCLSASSSGTLVRNATPSALAAAGQALGIVLLAAAPGGRVRVAIGGTLAPSITGLAAGSNRLVRVSAANRAEAVASLSTSDFPLGSTDAQGNLTLRPSASASSSSGSWHGSVRLVLRANDTLSGLGARNTVTPVAGDRVLAVAQSTASQNLVYKAASGAWTVDTDMSAALLLGAVIEVQEGTPGAGEYWQCTTIGAITVGSTSITWKQLPFVVNQSATALARTGNVRLAKDVAGGAYYRNNADNGDYLALGGDGADGLVVGDSLNTTNAQLQVKSSGSILLGTSGANWLALTSALAALLTPTVQFNEGISSPTLNQNTQTSDIGTHNLTIAPQAPFATATGANRTPGSLVVALADPTNGGTGTPFLKITQGASAWMYAGKYTGGAPYGAIYLGQNITPSSVNFAFLGDGSTVSWLNAPSGGQVNLGVNSVVQVGVTTSLITLAPPTMQWAIGVTTPKLNQADQTANSTAGQLFTVAAQNATGTTSTGGGLTLASGTGTTAAGTLLLKAGATTRFTADATGIGFYTTAGVAQQTRAGQLTGAFGSTGTAIVDAGAAYSQTNCNNNFRALEDAFNRLETIVHNLGLST